MKNEKLYLTHIVEAAVRMKRYLPATMDEFGHNEMIQDAVIKVLANITESASNLESMSKSAYPHIPWRMIRGLRNILVHDYLGDLDYEEVWKTIHHDLPPLIEAAQTLLKEKYGTEL